MNPAAWTWWLRAAEGPAKRITPAGLLLGRSAHCDLVVADEQASRRHALVYLGSDGPRLVPLGHVAPQVDGEAATGPSELADGAVLSVFDLELCVSREAASKPGGGAAWVIASPSGTLFGISSSPFLVGGHQEDDLLVEGWPAAALCFRMEVDGELTVESSEALVHNGEPVGAGAVTRLRPSDELLSRGETVKVVTGGALNRASTVREEPPREPRRRAASPAVESARLEFLARGARLHLRLAGEMHSLYLTDRRSDLVAILLQPPTPLSAGEFLDDEIVLGRVWGKKRVDRTHLNVLLHRVRKDLARVGLDGAALLQRSEGGGATRFVLAPGATVELE